MNILKKLFSRNKNRDRYLYRSGWDLNPLLGDFGNDMVRPMAVGEEPQKDKRKVVKPVSVYNEILSEEPVMDLEELDGQIAVVKTRMRMLKKATGIDANNPSSDEYVALEFLKARKKYLKHKDKFGWALSTPKLIAKLLKKYQLRMVNVQGYYRTLPGEALAEMEKFATAWQKVRDDEPEYKLIIDADETKKDPILLGCSPFGRWYYVLGAWDKEVEIVDKIVYKGK
jgi:hypothetical protein